MSTIFGRIRRACELVSERAHFVRIDEAGLEALADRLAHMRLEPAVFDPAHHHLATTESTVAYILCLDAVNFGSGYFPHMKKRAGCSGYFTVARCLKERFEAGAPLSTADLVRMTARECAEIFEQDLDDPAMAELMAHFAAAWRELGELVSGRFEGDFGRLVASAECRAASLVELLACLPAYHDVARHGELLVPFYKRAQLTCSDLALAFAGSGPGAFSDLEELTMFADNLVPHVLRFEGALVYRPDLLARIDAGELIPSGAAEEVEIRAVALHAVERLCRALARRGCAMTAQRLDNLLWSRGQDPAVKAEPRHRTRSLFY